MVGLDIRFRFYYRPISFRCGRAGSGFGLSRIAKYERDVFFTSCQLSAYFYLYSVDLQILAQTPCQSLANIHIAF